MNALHIFRQGKHRDSRGRELEFSAETLQAAVAAYDPALHEAPIVIGHPRDNAPAYGWVSGIKLDDSGNVFAEPAQVNEDFAELVRAGAYKKISASWYLPDAPENPKPGAYYLRHVGFLGAQPPAIKGLRQAAFADAPDSVVEFGAWETSTIARVFQSLREWLIDKFDRDQADSVIPSYVVDDLRAAAEREIRAESEPTPAVGFAESTPKGGSTMTEAEIQALRAEAATAATLREQLATAQAQATQRETEFAERERALAARETEARRANIASRVDTLVTAGRVLPAQKPRICAFLEALPANGAVSFTEGTETRQTDLMTAFCELLATFPQQVDFGEHAGVDKGDAGADFAEADVAARAKAIADYVDAERAKGRTVSFAEADAELTKKKAA